MPSSLIRTVNPIRSVTFLGDRTIQTCGLEISSQPFGLTGGVWRECLALRMSGYGNHMEIIKIHCCNCYSTSPWSMGTQAVIESPKPTLAVECLGDKPVHYFSATRDHCTGLLLQVLWDGMRVCLVALESRARSRNQQNLTFPWLISPSLLPLSSSILILLRHIIYHMLYQIFYIISIIWSHNVPIPHGENLTISRCSFVMSPCHFPRA